MNAIAWHDIIPRAEKGRLAAANTILCHVSYSAVGARAPAIEEPQL